MCSAHQPNLTKKYGKINKKLYFAIENNIILSSNVILGGNVHIMNGSQVGMRVSIHQNQVIGSYTMIGMGSIITKKKIVRPGYVFYGKPIRLIKKNNISLNKNKINSKSLTTEFLRYKKLKKSI